MQPEARTPETTRGVVAYLEIPVPSCQPLPGGKRLSDIVRRFESDPVMAERLASARRRLASELVSGESLQTIRDLRLRAGLSQAKLAERARSTQAYVARIEAGTVDPGTDMVARLAFALGVDDAVVFSLVRRQRERAAGTNT
jgi:ribosome-binding protein aMBF1 (putative translation factor)